MNQVGSYDEELEAIEFEFLEALENGQRPTLEGYITRYPHLKQEISEFVLNAVGHRVRMVGAETAGGNEEDEAGVVRFLRETPIKAESISKRIRDLGLSGPRIAASVNVPVDIIVSIQRQLLSGLPKKLIVKLSRVLRLPIDITTQLTMSLPPKPRLASAYRADGEPGASIDENQTFEQAMLGLQKRGKVTAEQAAEWLGKSDG